MVQLQKVGRSGIEPAEYYTFDYAGINEEEDHMGGPCSKCGRGKKIVQNFRQNS